MELNWTTLVLEILNFLVLVWLLKRFFYQPVQTMVARRREGIAAQLQEAEGHRRQAEGLRQQYENRLADWEAERELARQTLQQELEAERERLRQELQQGLEAEREKQRVLAIREQELQQREVETQALTQGARFVARLLERLASPEVEARLCELLLSELRALPAAEREALQAVQNGSALEVVVASVYPLAPAHHQRLEQQLQQLLPLGLHFSYQQNPALIAGLHITVGPWVMHANLRDELKTFAAIAYEQ
jgi:F-type H+-transporting ATPase subunit b